MKVHAMMVVSCALFASAFGSPFVRGAEESEGSGVQKTNETGRFILVGVGVHVLNIDNVSLTLVQFAPFLCF